MDGRGIREMFRGTVLQQIVNPRDPMPSIVNIKKNYKTLSASSNLQPFMEDIQEIRQ